MSASHRCWAELIKLNIGTPQPLIIGVSITLVIINEWLDDNGFVFFWVGLSEYLSWVWFKHHRVLNELMLCNDQWVTQGVDNHKHGRNLDDLCVQVLALVYQTHCGVVNYFSLFRIVVFLSTVLDSELAWESSTFNIKYFRSSFLAGGYEYLLNITC